MGRSALKYLPMCSVAVNVHIKYHIYIFPKGAPCCIFCENGERVNREPQNSSLVLVPAGLHVSTYGAASFFVCGVRFEYIHK